MVITTSPIISLNEICLQTLLWTELEGRVMGKGPKHWHLTATSPGPPRDLSLSAASFLGEEEKGEEHPAHQVLRNFVKCALDWNMHRLSDVLLREKKKKSYQLEYGTSFIVR